MTELGETDLEYLGNKSKIAKEIRRVIAMNLKKGGTYIEPFCGGCNMASALIDLGYNIKLYDINKVMIEFLKKGQEGYLPPLKSEISSYEEKNKIVNSSDVPDWKKGETIYLNSYRGTRWGYDKHVYNRRRNSYLKTVSAIKDFHLETMDYKDLNFDDLDKDNTLIYCDIPYIGTRIDNYCKASGNFNHNAFWQWVRDHKDFKIIVSEISAPNDFKVVWKQSFTYKIGTNFGTSHRKIEECLFVYKESLDLWKIPNQVRLKLI